MQSQMKMIYLGSGDHALQTGLGAIGETNADTWRAFNRARNLAVPIERATFLLDYYNARGNLSDTIALDDDGFRRVTGERVRSATYYQRVDAEYWEVAASRRTA